MADRIITTDLGLIGLDIADTPFGFPERLEFSDINTRNLQIIDSSVFGRTTGSLTIFVDHAAAAGGDGTSAAPFNSLEDVASRFSGKYINNSIRVKIASGSYSGFSMGGIVFGPGTADQAPYLMFEGTMITSSLSSGVASGTLTAATGGTSSTLTYGTFTDPFNSWDVDSLRGKWIAIVEGTGAGQAIPIYSNTPTVGTILGAWVVTPTSGSRFAIMEPGTEIQQNCRLPAYINGAFPSNGTGSIAVYNVYGASPTPTDFQSSNLTFKSLKFPGSGSLRSVYSAGVSNYTFDQCWFSASSANHTDTFVRDNARLTSRVSFRDCVGSFRTSTGGLYNSSGNGFVILQRTAILGGVRVIQHAFNNVLQSFNCLYYGQTQAAFQFDFKGGHATLSGDRYDGALSGGSGITFATPYTDGVITISSCDISNWNNGVYSLGPKMLFGLTSVQGTGNTTAIRIEQGASVKIASNVSLSGTAQVVIDGTTTNFNLVRAASPKVINNNTYFSRIFEV